MRFIAAGLIIFLPSIGTATAQSDDGFSGSWKFNPANSEVHSLPAPPDPFLKVEQSVKTLTIHASQQEGGPSVTTIYPLNGSASKHRVGGSTLNTMTKWEGSALLVNTIVSGPQNYTVMERWRKSRDGNTLTIKRTIARAAGESESVLIYQSPAAPTTSRAPSEEEYLIAKGTRVLLRLINSVNTKNTA